MNVTCPKCDLCYDDADRNTICPHPLIMPREDLERKKLAISLMGQPLRFTQMNDGKPMRIQTINWDGMIEFAELSGQFAPHLFKVVEDER